MAQESKSFLLCALLFAGMSFADEGAPASQAFPDLETMSVAETNAKSVATDGTVATDDVMETESEKLLHVIKDCFTRAFFKVLHVFMALWASKFMAGSCAMFSFQVLVGPATISRSSCASRRKGMSLPSTCGNALEMMRCTMSRSGLSG